MGGTPQWLADYIKSENAKWGPIIKQAGISSAVANAENSKVRTMPERLPKNTCDTHLHIFGDPRAYPAANPNALYAPPGECNFDAVKALHDAMGVDRAVFVQPTIYGTDHRLLHDVLKDAPKRTLSWRRHRQRQRQRRGT